MKKYKVSKYIVTSNSDENIIDIIKNTLTQKINRVKLADATILQSILEGTYDINANKEDDLVQRLIKNGYLVEDTLNEGKLARYMFNKEVYGSRELELTILPTNACNFDCVYCYQKPPYHFMTNETKNNLVSYIKKHIHEYSGLKIAWFGGEPLLAKDMLVEFMNEVRIICKENKKPLYSNITTNGYELDGQTFERLLKSHVRTFQITLDGPEHIHNMQRPHKGENNSFERIVSNLRYIREHYSNKTFIIILRINVSTVLLPYMEEYKAWLISEFGEDRHFTINYEVIRDWGGDKVKKHEQLRDYQEDVMKYMDDFTNKGISIDKGFHRDIHKVSICLASKMNGFVINYDGKIYKCTMNIENEKCKDINNIGFLNNNGEMILDTNKVINWVENTETLSKCDDCKHYPECMGLSCPLNVCLGKKDLNCASYYNDKYEYVMRNRVKNSNIEYL